MAMKKLKILVQLESLEGLVLTPIILLLVILFFEAILRTSDNGCPANKILCKVEPVFSAIQVFMHSAHSSLKR